MRKIYGRSIVEGAPYGNQNAAGPHTNGNRKSKKLKFQTATIDYRKNSMHSAKSITIDRNKGLYKPTARTKVYKSPSMASVKRLQNVLHKGESIKGTIAFNPNRTIASRINPHWMDD
jgi:hypothetical protein